MLVYTRKNKASELFQSFMDNVQSLQGCLEKVIRKQITKMEASEIEVLAEIRKVICNRHVIRKCIDLFIDAASSLKLFKTEVIASAGGVVKGGTALCNVPRAASDIPEISQAAVKGPLALTKSARAGLIVTNALFLGVDIFFICKDSYSLHKGSETEVSKFIRARAALWSSEINSWKKIHDSLCKGQKTSEKDRAVLDRTFYPRRAIESDN
ncbi:uncharacterized protein LOC115575646 [Sparus aurata]|uniref:uncharacterized protein LOC115575646 n=1 Tax=Sparus aurata TaxID=8175 RepID=UPI0011C10CB8|nr:uncharacterized protein LOC115575646 [Sparus aurata]